ncbi:MAG: response regulator [Nitrospinae bacterium]|nr:response regulator [Nitrospinota bacterium]
MTKTFAGSPRGRWFAVVPGHALMVAVALMLAAPPCPAFALEPLLINPSMDGVYLGLHVEHLEDATGKLTLDEITSPLHKQRFVPEKQKTLGFGFSDSVHWFHFLVQNPGGPARWNLQMEHILLSRVTVFEGVRETGYRRHEGGNQIPFDRREIAHRKNVFPMTAPTGASEVYVEIRPYSKMAINAYMTAWDENHFIRASAADDFILAFFYGVMAAMFFYNLFIYVSVRDISYLWYVSYLFFATLTYFAANGFAFQYWWPDSAYLAREGIWTLYAAAYAFIFLFTRSFLETRGRLPVLDKALAAAGAASAGISALAASDISFYFVNSVAYPLTLLFPLLLLLAGFLSMAKGARQARFYILAWSFFITGMIVYILKDSGTLPYTSLTVNSVQAGTMFEALLLSLALADRIRILRAEKEHVEALHRDNLERSKETLERMVAERTTDLVQAKERAESATKLKDRFVELVSHDLRSPIGSIKVALELALQRAGPMKDERDREAILTLAHESSGRLLDFIDHLLDVSRMRTGTITLHKRWVEMRPYVEGYRKGLLPGAEQKGIRVDNLVPEEARLFIDPALYGEALRNLLANAIKFCRSGDVVSIHMPKDDPRALAVKDTGPGIDPELLPDIFSHEVLTTSRGSQGEVGTGIGLPHSYDILKAHGGELVVRTAPGEGAAFVMRLPEVRAVALLVDDQDPHRAMMREELKALDGVETIEAADGIAALQTLSETRVDLIITDIQMPNMDGYALIGELRKNPFFAGVPIIVATSTEDSPSARSRAFELGADDYVVKPIRTADFLPRVRHFIG